MDVANTFFLKNLNFLLKKVRVERNKKKKDILADLKMDMSTLSRWNRRETLSNPNFERVVEYFAGELNVMLTQEVDQRFLPYLAQYRHNTRRTILIDCRAAFNRAVAWRYLGENPFAGINTKARKTVPVFYSEQELATMAAYFARPEIPDWQGDAVLLVLNTGLRRTELTTLTWSNVLLEERRLVVRGAKHDKERVIPLNRTALEVLRRRPRPRGKKRVFWECNREGFGTAFKRMQQRTGLGGNIHQLRKTFASRCAINGMPLIKLKEILGHSDIQTVMIYATLAPDYMQDARDMPDISPGAP